MNAVQSYTRLLEKNGDIHSPLQPKLDECFSLLNPDAPFTFKYYLDRGERGWVSYHSSGSSAEIIADTANFIQFDNLNIGFFSAVERFLYLRDFLNYLVW